MCDAIFKQWRMRKLIKHQHSLKHLLDYTPDDLTDRLPEIQMAYDDISEEIVRRVERRLRRIEYTAQLLRWAGRVIVGNQRTWSLASIKRNSTGKSKRGHSHGGDESSEEQGRKRLDFYQKGC